MNYTRKLQHFAAYLVPLLLHTRAAAAIRGPLTLSWGSFVTMLGFLVLIKPLRERFTFFMLQFNVRVHALPCAAVRCAASATRSLVVLTAPL